MVNDRFDSRAIERSQGTGVGPTLQTSDSLRSFMETAPRRPREGVGGAIRAQRYVIDVRNPSGRVIKSYNADTEDLVAEARRHAKEIEGYTTAHEVLDDFR